MKMMCPHCNIEMIMGFKFYPAYLEHINNKMGWSNYNDKLCKDVNGYMMEVTPVACICPKCKKIEWYAYTPKRPQSKADDYKNLY